MFECLLTPITPALAVALVATAGRGGVGVPSEALRDERVSWCVHPNVEATAVALGLTGVVKSLS